MVSVSSPSLHPIAQFLAVLKLTWEKVLTRKGDWVTYCHDSTLPAQRDLVPSTAESQAFRPHQWTPALLPLGSLGPGSRTARSTSTMFSATRCVPSGIAPITALLSQRTASLVLGPPVGVIVNHPSRNGVFSNNPLPAYDMILISHPDHHLRDNSDSSTTDLLPETPITVYLESPPGF